MQTLTTVNEIAECVSKLRFQGQRIGFVPTMGALHAGHLSLIAASKAENDITICSIFVNPTQFNAASDFDKYPRQLSADLEVLKQANCDIVFAPPVEQVYPSADKNVYQLGEISEILEGTKRPGHFNGMASVVKRLFELCNPHKAYFGLKDYQQCLVVKSLVANYQMNVEIVCCPILRENSGLAMSSRNQLLSEAGKKTAQSIYNCLKMLNNSDQNLSIDMLKSQGESYLNNFENLELEYLEIRDANTLSEAAISQTKSVVILVAAWVDGVRLIDNMTMTIG